MAAPNGFPGQQGWPAKAPGATDQSGGQASNWPPQQQQGPSTQGRPVNAPAPQAQWNPPAGNYAQPAQSAAQTLAAALQGRGAGQQAYTQAPYAPPQQSYAAGPESYAPQFEPYAASQQPQQQSQADGRHGSYAQAQQYNLGQRSMWTPGPPPGREYEVGSYAPTPQPQAAHYRGQPAATDWGQPATAYADDPYHQQQADDLGFAQASGGELDPGYDEDDQEYEEETPRRRRPMMVLAALAGAVLVGGGLAYGYKSIIGGGANGQPPIVKSAAEPSQTKPADAGGKQFAHSDSKIMGRLGEGSAAAASTSAASSSASAESDSTGTRKVPTLIVGRDGTIQPPPAAASESAAAEGAVPGLTVVDGIGPPANKPAAAPQVVNSPQAAPQPQPQKVAVAPPAAAPQPAPQATGSVGEAAGADAVKAAPPPVAKPKKIAAVAPQAAAPAADAAPVAQPPSGNGFVAVIASVPVSGSSRMDALKRYADMHQKYAELLTGKTPDVTEANLGAKGNYHRLVVGPPGSRAEASSLCTKLKAQGYADCWVTAY